MPSLLWRPESASSLRRHVRSRNRANVHHVVPNCQFPRPGPLDLSPQAEILISAATHRRDSGATNKPHVAPVRRIGSICPQSNTLVGRDNAAIMDCRIVRPAPEAMRPRPDGPPTASPLHVRDPSPEP